MPNNATKNAVSLQRLLIHTKNLPDILMASGRQKFDRELVPIKRSWRLCEPCDGLARAEYRKPTAMRYIQTTKYPR